MTHDEMTALVRRANAAGHSSVPEYAVSLEDDKARLMLELQELVNVFLDAPFLRAERLLYDLDAERKEKAA